MLSPRTTTLLSGSGVVSRLMVMPKPAVSYSSQDGEFHILALMPGRYKVTALSPGMTPVVQESAIPTPAPAPVETQSLPPPNPNGETAGQSSSQNQ